MSITVDSKDEVFFIEANFSYHPDENKAIVYAQCTQDKTHYSGGTHVDWHQHWETGISREVSLAGVEYRSTLRELFSGLADNLEDCIRDERSKQGFPSTFFVRVFDDSDLDRLVEHGRARRDAEKEAADD